ncbi:MAG: SAF domain-containing protein [Ruthenibacterium lactatiformans]
MAAGENIIKYGYPIGHAASDIPPGAWVHTHNVRTNLSGEVEYTYAPDVRPCPRAARNIPGYRRADGRVGAATNFGSFPPSAA